MFACTPKSVRLYFVFPNDARRTPSATHDKRTNFTSPNVLAQTPLCFHTFGTLASKICPSGYSKSVYVSACTQNVLTVRFCSPERCPTNTLRNNIDIGRRSSYSPLPSLSSFGAACVKSCIAFPFPCQTQPYGCATI